MENWACLPCCLWLSLHSHTNFDPIFEDLPQPPCLWADSRDHPSPTLPLTREAEGRQPGLHPCSALTALQSTSEPGEGTRARWGQGQSLIPAPHPTLSTKWTPASSHNRCTSRLTPSRNGFILEPHCFIKTVDLPRTAQISLLSGGLLNTAGSEMLRKTREDSRGRRRAKRVV